MVIQNNKKLIKDMKFLMQLLLFQKQILINTNEYLLSCQFIFSYNFPFLDFYEYFIFSVINKRK